MSEHSAIVRKLPNTPTLEYAERIPGGLVGSKILNFGTTGRGHPELDGLVIDVLTDDNERKRIVIYFNELGMWTEQ